MSLVVRPKRANKKAIDYAQLANGSMSVEDADESPPPQSAGNGKRKLEPTPAPNPAYDVPFRVTFTYTTSTTLANTFNI